MTLARGRQTRGSDRCHSRTTPNGRWRHQTQNANDIHASGGGIYFRNYQLPPLQFHPGPRPHRIRRSVNQTAEDPKTQQCPADVDHCEQKVVPTLYVYPKDEKNPGVWVLDPLPLDKYDAFQKEVEDAKKSEIDIVQAYGARWVDHKSKDPGLKAISEGTHGNRTTALWRPQSTSTP